ncbi:MAG: HAD family hydrolase [Lachnospiraceae bacterium]
MYKACIFDLDGTLTDTLESITYSVNQTLLELKLEPISKEECRRFVGNGAQVLIEKALGAAGDVDLLRRKSAMETYGRIFDANCNRGVKPYEGIIDLLEELQNLGIQIGVLSNKPHAQTVKVVKEIFRGQYFKCIQGQCDEIPRKPNAIGAWAVARQLQVRPEECLYIGDSEVDIKTGAAAGMTTVSVAWGFRSKEELEHAEAASIVDNPKELLEWIQMSHNKMRTE